MSVGNLSVSSLVPGLAGAAIAGLATWLGTVDARVYAMGREMAPRQEIVELRRELIDRLDRLDGYLRTVRPAPEERSR